jgi:hypothetical protein
LEGRLKTWATAQSIPVAWQNTAFTKPATQFLEPFLIPVVVNNSNVAGKRATYLGIFQVNCWSPIGPGMGDVETLAQSVVNLFPLLPKVGGVSIESTPSALDAIKDDSGNWIIVPVRISYRYEASI